MFFPVAQSGWVDLVAQGPHGFSRIQVKTVRSDDQPIRVRRLGSRDGMEPSDRYDTLAVVNTRRLWMIPAGSLEGRDEINLKPHDIDCPWNVYRRR